MKSQNESYNVMYYHPDVSLSRRKFACKGRWEGENGLLMLS